MTHDDRFRDSDDLWRDFERTATAPGGDAALAHIPDDSDDLIRLVGEALREKFDELPPLDEDRDYVLHHLGQQVWVHVDAEFPAITILARVAHGVYSRRSTEVELGILNRQHPLTRWVLGDRSIWQRSTLIALPFAPAHLILLLDQFFDTMSSTRDDLAYRTGAKVA
ncbi:T3SS (YopN, CesT) and YbjN peptide-binding chaperone 1 [Gordonia crocea]|uniref:TY-Chap central domain-containing protein n=1 Tax=Gordonia crocea TaxID=589162 RepID=A0A7M4BQ64_9ACTN|nr:hypothetical protein [Gordonia crocea]GED96025.1 hypothetical protein nbrc107697_00640 [Gordonia crocea]